VTFPSGLRALDHRDFRLFWTGQLVSLIGTWMQSVAQSWLVLQLSGSPLKLGLIGTFQFAPVLLFSVVAGAIVDRLPKRRLILATQTLLALQAFTLTALVWTGHVRYWHVAVLALLLGCANVIDMPTRQAFIVEMVGRGDLVNAVALNSAAFNGARIVGPALAGLLIGRFGLAPAFLLNGLSFLAVLGALSLVRAEGAPRPRAATTMGEDVLAGLRYALSTPRVALMLSLVLVVSLCVMNFSVFVPLLARNVLRLDAAGFGFLMAALGVGAVTGALSLATLGGRQTPLRAILLAGVLACLTLLGLAAAPEFHAAVVLLFLTGFFSIV
jgi:MFS family permease